MNNDTIEWFSGIDNYRKHTLTFGKDSNTYILELLDVESRKVSTIHDAIQMHLDGANLPIEVFYSGGIDSEAVIKACLDKNIPVKAMTLRYVLRGAPINIRDLYYAEKFCRENNVQHNIVDLDIGKFYTNGDHIQYLTSFKFGRFFAAPMLWLLHQCSSFPVIGGDYSWPQINIGKKLYSPHRHDSMCFDKYMQDNGISGIGNMLSHSLDSNIIFVNEHIKTHSNDPFYKDIMFHNLGFPLEKRFRSFGWETIDSYRHSFDWLAIHEDLIKRNGETRSIIKWNKTFADAMGGVPGENDSRGVIEEYQGAKFF